MSSSNDEMGDILRDSDKRDVLAIVCQAFHPDTSPADRVRALAEIAIGFSTSPEMSVNYGGAMCAVGMALGDSDQGREVIDVFRKAIQDAAMQDGRA